MTVENWLTLSKQRETYQSERDLFVQNKSRSEDTFTSVGTLPKITITMAQVSTVVDD